MKKIERVTYESLFYGDDKIACALAALSNKINELVDAHNELLETETVKEQKKHIHNVIIDPIDGASKFCSTCEKYISDAETIIPPSNSEKEECCHLCRIENPPCSGSCYCHQTKEEPTTPEKCPGKYCVYSSVPTCPFDGSIHVATPEKKCCDESMLVAGYIKTPSGWIAHGEATPGQMTYHFAWLKNKKK